MKLALRVALQTLTESFRDSPTRLDPSILRDWLNIIWKLPIFFRLSWG